MPALFSAAGGTAASLSGEGANLNKIKRKMFEIPATAWRGRARFLRKHGLTFY